MMPLVLSILLLLVGCVASPEEIPDFIRAEGVATRLPIAGDRVAVLGWYTDDVARNVVTLWLQRHGVTVLERAELGRVLNQQDITLRLVDDREADRLDVGHLTGITQLIFVDVEFYGESATVRGVDLQSGKILWQGSAGFRTHHCCYPEAEMVRHALMAAWHAHR